MNVVAYARYSSDNQREESITAQIRSITEFAEKMGLTITKKYIDEAKSAKTDDRPQFLNLIEDVKSHKISHLFVHKMDRFSRNRYDSLFYKKILKDNNVALISVLEHLDGSPESIILEGVIDAMAEYYSANLSREVKKGLKENALLCIHTGGLPPWGYKVTMNKEYIIDEKIAPAVKKVFKMVCEYKTSTEICEWLNGGGFYTQFGNKFTKSSIISLVSNEKYKGTYFYNKFKRKKIDGKLKDILHNEEEVIRIPGGMPNIITAEVWDKANEIMKTRRSIYGSPTANRIYLLTGIIFCGICGSHMVGEHTNSRGNRAPRTIYNCRGRKTNKGTSCYQKAVLKEKIEEITIKSISEPISPEVIEIAIQTLYDEVLQFNSNLPLAIENLNFELSEVSIQIDKLIILMLELGNTKSLKEKFQNLENEKNDIQERLLFYKQKEKELSLPPKQILRTELLSNLDIKNKSPQEQKSILQTFIKKILVCPDHVIITMDRGLNYGDEENRTPVRKPIHRNFSHHSCCFKISLR